MCHPHHENEIDGEEDYDNKFQQQHALLVNLSVDDAVDFIHLRQPLFDARSPLIEIESVPRAEIYARQMPVAEEFSNVSYFIGEFGHVHSESTQMLQRLLGTADERAARALEV